MCAYKALNIKIHLTKLNESNLRLKAQYMGILIETRQIRMLTISLSNLVNEKSSNKIFFISKLMYYDQALQVVLNH